jgi:carbonic anhydrase
MHKRNTPHIYGKHQSPIDLSHAINSNLPNLKFNYKTTRCKPYFNGHTIQVDYHAGSYLFVGKHKFQLLQLHFHIPSERSINGIHHPMVIHIVHTSPKKKFYALIAVIIDEGDFNSSLQKLLDNLKHNIEFNVSSLLPRNIRSYFYYHGSLTTSPYTENVHWIILKEPIKATKQQIQEFHKIIGSNARQIQKSFNRMIRHRN